MHKAREQYKQKDSAEETVVMIVAIIPTEPGLPFTTPSFPYLPKWTVSGFLEAGMLLEDFKTTSVPVLILSKGNLNARLNVYKYEWGPQSQHVKRGRKIFVQVQLAGFPVSYPIGKIKFLFSQTETIDQKERKPGPVNEYMI